MTGTTRSSEGLDTRRRRLLYRSWRRGTREADLVVGRFADSVIGSLSEAELDQFERLLEVPDDELMAWVMGWSEAPAPYDTGVFRRLQTFNRATMA